ncbi:MAG: RNA polymerase sigma factor [Saprospiraceae bacterium]
MNDSSLIIKAGRQDRKAQTLLYEQYQRAWYMICLRYNKNTEDAQDSMQNGLIRIFSNIGLFDEKKGNFKSWSSKIMVNESLMYLRKKASTFRVDSIDDLNDISENQETPLDAMSAEELTKMIQRLPDGYRVVFNMYVIEGYTHQEIAETLQINEGTSKSQLFKAKKMLQLQLESQLQQKAYVRQ